MHDAATRLALPRLHNLALWTLGFPAVERVDSRLFAGGARIEGEPDRCEDYAHETNEHAVGAVAEDPALRLALTGDWNIAPRDEDVWDMAVFAKSTHVTPPERAALAELQALGLRDVVRDRWPDHERLFTYWDYRAGMFHQDLGMRIDLVLASTPVAERVRAAWVDRQARKGTGPSDHAPVIVDLDVAPDGDEAWSDGSEDKVTVSGVVRIDSVTGQWISPN